MPVFQSGLGQAPSWCEMTHFEFLPLAAGETKTVRIDNAKEKWMVVEGSCVVTVGGRPAKAPRASQLDFTTEDGEVTLGEAPEEGALIVRMCGHWGDELGGAGLFFVVNSDAPKDAGDPVSYPKRTNFDAHYHDCDEYWIIYEGSGVAVTENRSYEVKAGDCVATGRGHHHDFPLVHGDSPVKAVFFETTMEGLKRKGHLWEHTHGPAVPAAERV